MPFALVLKLSNIGTNVMKKMQDCILKTTNILLREIKEDLNKREKKPVHELEDSYYKADRNSEINKLF